MVKKGKKWVCGNKYCPLKDRIPKKYWLVDTADGRQWVKFEERVTRSVAVDLASNRKGEGLFTPVYELNKRAHAH